MMCRVVEDKYRPLDRYTPSMRAALKSKTPYLPADIIPDLLPEPIVQKVLKDKLAVYQKAGIAAELGVLLGLKVVHENKGNFELETKEVKQYILSNPTDYFDELMENEHYSTEVKKFLLTVKRKRGRLVTGFLTTSDAVWKRTVGRSSDKSGKVSVPVDLALQAAGVPVPPGLTNPAINPDRAEKMTLEKELRLGKDEIFAVSYSPIKISWWDNKPVAGAGMKAKRHQLAFGDEDEDPEVVDLSKADILDLDFSRLDVDVGDEDDGSSEEDEEGDAEEETE
ncbi:Hypothetical protein PENO1_092430 [Penicillium occitanis (nom. inval.)]|nr:Hypothetical protein PENO1_092430 [Penicillium occitanis (nom. inval.)]PCG92113.1 hypothetical protein PENOC_094090 [Penicillium occitanis (nom. inval.)]